MENHLILVSMFKEYYREGVAVISHSLSGLVQRELRALIFQNEVHDHGDPDRHHCSSPPSSIIPFAWRFVLAWTWEELRR